MFSSELWNKPAGGAGGGDFYTHQIANSCRWDGTSSKLVRDPSSTGNLQVLTFSTWVKRSGLGSLQKLYICGEGVSYGYYSDIGFDANDKLFARLESGGTMFLSTQVFRDTSAYYHIVMAIDTTQGTADNRCKVYVNGERITAWATDPASTISQNYNTSYTTSLNGSEQWVGAIFNNSYYFNGYMAETYLVDGTQLAIGDTGETKNGVWIPKDPSGFTYGTNGFLLNYASSSDLGNDVSGNNNDFTPTGIAAHDQMLDSPTFNSDSNGGNFCTLNPIYRGSDATASTYGTVSIGNLKHHGTGGNGGIQLCTFLVPPSGKWYWEYAIIAGGAPGPAYDPGMGISDPNVYFRPDSSIDSTGLLVYDNATNKTKYNSSFVTTYDGSRGADGDVMGIAVDMDNGAFYVSKNGTFYSSGDPTSGSSRTNAGVTWTPASAFTSGMIPTSTPTGGTVPIININFGQDGTFQGTETAGGNSDTNGYGNFYSSVPSGYSAICTGALSMADAVDPAQTDDDYPSKVFSAITYTGTGSEKAVAVGWQPDLTWVKERSGTNDNKLTDSVRGATKALESNTDAAETTDAQGVKAFTGTGFTLGTDAVYNNNTDTYISWNWKEGADYGLDIVAYSGSLTGTGVVNISHSLGAIPECIWHMSRSAIGGAIRHQSLTSANYMMTNAASSGAGTGWGSGAQVDKSGNGNMTALGTSSTFTTNYTGILNQNGDDAVAYVWRGIEGFSKFGGYTGNGNADGPFVYTGFSPAYVIIKRRDGVESFFAMDNKRIGFNVVEDIQQLNGSGADDTTNYDALDFLSNGFKLRLSDAGFNGSEQYIYMAWAENPFKYATAR